SGLPWELLLLRAKIRPPEEIEERWRLLKLALQRAERDIPDVAGAGFVGSWLANKEELQALVLQAAKEAVTKGVASALDLVDVFEFLNGREIRPALREDPNT